MHIVLFVHPAFLGSQSMPRFANMLSEGMRGLGHSVEVWSPKAFFFRLAPHRIAKKWFGYIDQYLIFPLQVRQRMRGVKSDTLFVFADQALGPWVPLVCKRPHVIHCHDFLAQRSALQEIPENITGRSGRLYQRFIRNGYIRGKNFISVSEETRNNLSRFLKSTADRSIVVYNGLNRAFFIQDAEEARARLAGNLKIELTNGYLLHVGGNQWYKNRQGVIEMYNAWRSVCAKPLPLLMVGPPANAKLVTEYQQSAFKSDIHFVSGMEDLLVNAAYSGASMLLFPSIAEGFGWPIAEAMACGCPVITTDLAPMNEVGGDAAFYIKRRPDNVGSVNDWARACALKINEVLNLSIEQLQAVKSKGVKNAERFDTASSLKAIEKVYIDILQTYGNS